VNIDWGGLWTVLVVGLLAGVGILALFSVGIRVLATQPSGRRSATAVVGASACFAICALAAVYGVFLLLKK
jgi:hypothetical protein